MSEFIQYSDFFKPGTEQEFRAYLQKLGDIAKQETAKIITNLQAMSKGITNDITAQNIKAQANLTDAIEKGKKRINEISTLEKERLRVAEEYDKLSAKYAASQDEINRRNEEYRQHLSKINADRKLEAKLSNEAIGSYKRMSLELSKNIEAYKRLSQAERDNVNIGGKLLKTIQSQQTSLKKMDAEMGNFQRNVGNYNGAVDKAKGLMLKWLAAIGGVWGALRIGKSVIDSAESSSDRFAVTMGKAKSAFEFFQKSLATGDFSNFFKNMKQAIEAGAEYARQLDEIEDRNRALTIAEAEVNIEKQTQLKILRDATKTDEERIAAGNKIIQQENELMRLRVSIAEQAKNARIDSFKALGITEETVIANLKEYESNKGIISQADEYNERLKLRSQLTQIYANTTIPLTEKEKQTFKELNDQISATDKSVIAFADLRSKYTKLSGKELDELTKLYVDLYNAQASADEANQRVNSRLSSLLAENKDKQDQLNGQKRTEIALQGTINELKQKQADIEKEIPSLNLETASGRSRLVDLQIELDRTKKLIEQWENFGKLTPLLGKTVSSLPGKPLELDVPVKVDLKQTEDNRTIWQKFLDNIGLNENEFQELAEKLTRSLTDLFSAWNDLITVQAENELNQHERTLEGLKSRLDKEKEAKDEQRANEFDALLTQIATEEKLRNEALEKYKKAQRQQAYVDMLAQQSQLGLAAAEIYAANAKTGPYGIIAGVALALSMVTSFISLQAKLKSINGEQKFAKGTEYVNGPGNETSDSIPARLSKGERIVDAKTNRQLEGIDNDQLPDVYKFYKFNMLRGEGAVQQYSNKQLLNVLRENKNINREMLQTLKDNPTAIQLADGRIMLQFGKNCTKIVSLNK